MKAQIKITLNIFLISIISTIIIFTCSVYINNNTNINDLKIHKYYIENEINNGSPLTLSLLQGIFASTAQHYKNINDLITVEIWDRPPFVGLSHPIWSIHEYTIYANHDEPSEHIHQIGNYILLFSMDSLLSKPIFVISYEKYGNTNINKFKDSYWIAIFRTPLNSFGDTLLIQLLTILAISFLINSFLFFLLNEFKKNYKNNKSNQLRNDLYDLIHHRILNLLAKLKSSPTNTELFNNIIPYTSEIKKLLEPTILDPINIHSLVNDISQSPVLKENIKYIMTIKIDFAPLGCYAMLFEVMNQLIDNASRDNDTTDIHINILQSGIFKNKILFSVSNNTNVQPKFIKSFLNKTSNSPKGSFRNGIGLYKCNQSLKSLGSILNVLKSSGFLKIFFYLRLSKTPLGIDSKEELIPLFKNNSNIMTQQSKINTEEKPRVLIIEDDTLLWKGWRNSMLDAKITFLKFPSEINSHHFKENECIISDFMFDDMPLNSFDFFTKLESHDYKGLVVICSGSIKMAKTILNDKETGLIDFFVIKDFCSYEQIISKAQLDYQ